MNWMKRHATFMLVLVTTVIFYGCSAYPIIQITNDTGEDIVVVEVMHGRKKDRVEEIYWAREHNLKSGETKEIKVGYMLETFLVRVGDKTYAYDINPWIFQFDYKGPLNLFKKPAKREGKLFLRIGKDLDVYVVYPPKSKLGAGIPPQPEGFPLTPKPFAWPKGFVNEYRQK